MISRLVRSSSGARMRMLSPSTAGSRREIGERLERRDELGPAIRISRVVERVHADEDVARAAHLGQRERVREKDRVARRNVRDRNSGCDPRALWEPRCSAVSADPPNARRSMSTIWCRSTPYARATAACGFDLVLVALAVSKRECIHVVSVAARERERRS